MAGRRLIARDLTRGTTLATRIAVAASFRTRLVGLLGRAGLADDEGLWIAGESSIHMLFMRFPIDCCFLGTARENGAREVLAVRHGLPPWRGVVWHVAGAAGTLELAAGALARAGVVVGDLVTLEEVDGD